MDKLKFITAGKSTFTIANTETTNRFTFMVKAPTETTAAGGKRIDRNSNVRFVSVLTGPDNENSYSFLGTIFLDGNKAPRYQPSRKSRFEMSAISQLTIDWLITRLKTVNALPDFITFHHCGYCGRCGRKLTVPESIESGFGPECINKV